MKIKCLFLFLFMVSGLLNAEYLNQEKSAKTYLPVDLSDVIVKQGTALDMSVFVPDLPAGSNGRIILGKNGYFTFKKIPGSRIKFNGCSMNPGYSNVMSSKESIENYAEQVRLNGFNILRPHFLDHYLMKNAKDDVDFNPESLDRFDYLVSCLKKNGIYIYLDAMTSWSGYVKGSSWNAKGVDLKRRMFWDPKARENWAAGVRKLMTHMNPYTKTTLAEDPVVAVVLLFNEQEIELRAKNLDTPELGKLWLEWLAETYHDTESLKKAWTDANGKCWLANDRTIENTSLNGGKYFWEGRTSPRGRDISRFLSAQALTMTDWYKQELEKMNYNGLISQWDFSNLLAYCEARNKVSVVSLHNYFAHPTRWIGKNSKIETGSSIRKTNYFANMSLLRMYDRPMFVPEYLHCFWNPLRYEQGIVAGAYGAFQDFDGLMLHAEPVLLKTTEPIKTFVTFNDPVNRASQVLTTYLFMRDCQPAKKKIEIVLDRKTTTEAGFGLKPFTDEYLSLALLHGMGMKWSDDALKEAGSSGENARIRLVFDGNIKTKKTILEIVDGPKLAASEIRGIEKGIFKSDTGQIKANTVTKSMQVICPGTEAVCMAKPVPVKLNRLSIDELSVPASVAAISVDGVDLSSSRRMLLIFSTDAVNSEMKFTDEGKGTLLDVGKLPVLMLAGKLRISLKNSNTGSLKAWALGFDGSRKEEIPLTAKADGAFEFTVDTSKLKNGPTPFFEVSDR